MGNGLEADDAVDDAAWGELGPQALGLGLALSLSAEPGVGLRGLLDSYDWLLEVDGAPLDRVTGRPTRR